jgi:glycosyltransferase involved in cell wall biosynthesis
MIPVYNSTTYLRQTLESILAQDPGPNAMQIEVVDGCSTINRPAELVRRIAGDRVSVFRHAAPLPMYANWNSCIERARGEWVHILHSDDFVRPGFYERLRAGVGSREDIGAAFCRWITVDANDRPETQAPLERPDPGVLENWFETQAVAQHIQFASIVVRKKAFAQAGGFRADLKFAVDWEMWTRLASQYAFWYEPETLACYRVHAGSETSRLQRAREDLADQGKCIRIIVGMLPPEGPTRRRVLRGLALRSVEIARGMFYERQVRPGLGQLWYALRLDRTASTLHAAMQTLGYGVRGATRSAFKRRGAPHG